MVEKDLNQLWTVEKVFSSQTFKMFDIAFAQHYFGIALFLSTSSSHINLTPFVHPLIFFNLMFILIYHNFIRKIKQLWISAENVWNRHIIQWHYWNHFSRLCGNARIYVYLYLRLAHICFFWKFCIAAKKHE